MVLKIEALERKIQSGQAKLLHVAGRYESGSDIALAAGFHTRVGSKGTLSVRT